MKKYNYNVTKRQYNLKVLKYITIILSLLLAIIEAIKK